MHWSRFYNQMGRLLYQLPFLSPLFQRICLQTLLYFQTNNTLGNYCNASPQQRPAKWKQKNDWWPIDRCVYNAKLWLVWNVWKLKETSGHIIIAFSQSIWVHFLKALLANYKCKFRHYQYKSVSWNHSSSKQRSQRQLLSCV